MAQLAQAFDANTIEPNNYEPLPPGEYEALIEESDMRLTRAGTGSYL